MIRSLISIPQDDKKWLDSYGRRHKLSRAELVRRAIKEYRGRVGCRDLQTVIRETAGSWKSVKGDSQKLVDGLRREWERP
jgi:metal-responsive CopG/Arc/MetJ family transcriptional regulator